jgi:hypothetical protein
MPKTVTPSKLFFASMAIVIFAGAWPAASALAGSTNLPPDVDEFISRRTGCLDWSKKASNPPDATGIRSVMLSMKCSDVQHDEMDLRKSYANNPDVIAALNATWIKIVKRVPVSIGVRTPPGTLPSDLDH